MSSARTLYWLPLQLHSHTIKSLHIKNLSHLVWKLSHKPLQEPCTLLCVSDWALTHITRTWLGLLLFHKPKPVLSLDMILDYQISSHAFSYHSASISSIMHRDGLHLNLFSYCFQTCKVATLIQKEYVVSLCRKRESTMGGLKSKRRLKN